GRPDPLDVRDVGLAQSADQLVLNEVLVLRGHVIVLADPHARDVVLRRLRLARPRLDMPTRGAVDRLLAEQLVIVLVEVALFEVLEAEVRAEEARRAVLQRDTAVAGD